MLRFGLFGFPVEIRWTFWLAAVLLSGNLGATDSGAIARLTAWVLAMLISIIWHELGHAVAFRRFGWRSEIELYHFGGLAKPVGGGPQLSRFESGFVALAGPFAGFFLWGAILATLFATKMIPMASDQFGLKYFIAVPSIANSEFLTSFVGDLLQINLLWGIINLFPVLPLDGGRVMEAVKGNTRHALQISVYAGFGIAIFNIILILMRTPSTVPLLRGSVFIALLFAILAFQNLQRLKGVATGFGPFR